MHTLQLLFSCVRCDSGLQTYYRRDFGVVAWIFRLDDPTAVVGPPTEAGWHDSDHRESPIVEHQGLSEGGGAQIEKALPGFIAEHDYGRCRFIGFEIARLNCTPPGRGHAKELEGI